MSNSKNIIEEKFREISDTKREWIEGWTRFGFVDKGVIYTLTGVFAALTALQFDDQTKKFKRAFF